MRIRTEEEVVLLCAHAERRAAQQERLEYLLGAGMVDWACLWQKASEQQVLPLVGQALLSDPLPALLPTAVIQQARVVRLRTLSYNLAVRAELIRIGESLYACGIPVTPLKGVHVAERLYDALDARKVGDIDILVPEAQLQAGRSTLRNLGYALASSVDGRLDEHTFHGTPFVRSASGITFVVELHWGINNPRFVTVDYQHLWERISARGGEQAALRPLPSEETLLFLALHLPKHDLGVLRLLADIDRLVRREGPGMDWAYVLGLARRWQVSGLLYFALQRAQMLLDTPVPPGVIAELQPSAWRRTLLELLAGPNAILRPPAWDHLRYNRFRLAYCAMLTPFSRCLDAYVYYLFARFGPRPTGVVGALVDLLRRLAHGLGWTGLVFARSLADRCRDWLYGAPLLSSTAKGAKP